LVFETGIDQIDNVWVASFFVAELKSHADPKVVLVHAYVELGLSSAAMMEAVPVLRIGGESAERLIRWMSPFQPSSSPDVSLLTLDHRMQPFGATFCALSITRPAAASRGDACAPGCRPSRIDPWREGGAVSPGTDAPRQALA
jgi:hypothetical protein